MTGKEIARAAFLSSVFLLATSAWVFSASAPQLPKVTLEDLKKVKLDPSILSNIDAELKVPQIWIDGAKKKRTSTWAPSPGKTSNGAKATP